MPLAAAISDSPSGVFLRGEAPRFWRDAAHWEYDSREFQLRAGVDPWPWDRRPERRHMAVLRTVDHAYVQFGDGSWLCFDLVADPTWRTTVTDPAMVLPLAQQRPEVIMNPVKIAEAFYYLHTQDRSCWTHELQLTPFATKPSY